MKKKKNRLNKIERSVYDKQKICDNTITIECIIEKLGFDPRKDNTDWWKKLDGYTCDDSKPNPFNVLTREESKFLRDTRIFKI